MEIKLKHLEVLRKNPLFFDMNESEIKEAVSIFKAKISTYKKNEFLHIDYEPFNYFGLVLSGVVSACIDDIDGNRMIMTEVTIGKTFGESLCFLKIKNSPVYVYATQNSEILWLSLDNLFCDNCDKLSVKLQKRFTEIIAKRPLEMNKRIQVLSKLKLRERIITYLSQLSADCEKKEITVPLNREDMAAYIGANRTALSRELSLMKKEGIIDFNRNKFFILH